MMRALRTSCVAAMTLALLICAAPAMAQDKVVAPTTPTAEVVKAPVAEVATTPVAEKPAERGFLEMNSEFCRQIDDFIAKTKKPCDYFSWGADLRLREVWGDNWTTLNESAPNHERHFQRYRARIWGTVTPVKNLDINARLVWEPRVIQKGPPTAGITGDYVWDEALFDNLSITAKKIADLPLTVSVGRMDIIKGDGWLVLDGTPLDGSRTIFFDAVRVIWEEEKINTTFEVDYIQNDDDGDWWLNPFNETNQRLIEQDEKGVIFYVTNKSIDKTLIEGYYIYKHDSPAVPQGADGQTHTVGTRLKREFDANWEGRGEFAYQWGNQAFPSAMMSHRAFALNSRVAYFFRDAKNSSVKAEYEFLSGDDPDSQNCNEAFDPLWGRWPQWSELYAYTDALERGRPGELTNLHRLGFGYETNPCKVLNFHANYHLLFADENSQRANAARFSNGGAFRGQLLEAKLSYKLSPHVTGHLVGEYFVPGNFYNENVLNDPAIFLRYELTFTW